MVRRLAAALALALLIEPPVLAAAAPSLPAYERVTVAPAKTSIYVGTVTLTMPAFVRKGGTYESAYTAKAFPYFFYNETGTLSVEMSDDQLRQLERREPLDFTGRALRADGLERRITGRATPRDATSGKLKVRVAVSRQTELIFNTTYQFGPQPAAAP